MGKEQGFIKLYRKVRDNALWRKPLHPAMAWIDILMEVQHSEEPQKVMLGMRILTCNRGESLKSFQTWADRWGWSRSRTIRYMQCLAREHMLVTKSEQQTTRLTVLNYDAYNPARSLIGQQMDSYRTANGLLSDTDNTVKTVENEKTGDPPAGSNLHDWTITFGRWWGALKHVNASPGYLGVLDPFFTTERRFEFAKFKVETDDLGRYHGLLKPWQLRDMLWDDLKDYRGHQAEGAKAYRAWQGKAGKLVEDVAAAIGERTDASIADRTQREPEGE